MTTIKPGHTHQLTGVLDAGTTLYARSGQHGTPLGALIVVATFATNDGTIDLLAGPAHQGLYGATGATLQVTGSLTNNGLIEIGGGAYGTLHRGAVTGATLADHGLVINNGTIVVGAAAGGVAANTAPGTAGLLNDTNRLSNTGLLEIAGGAGGAPGGTVLFSGYQTNNAGTIKIEAGGLAQGKPGAGGTLNISAQRYFQNTGQITIDGGEGTPGGQLLDYGTLSNAGRISIGSGSDVRYGSLNYLTGSGGMLTVESGGMLENTGTVVADGGYYNGGSVQIDGTLVNSGSLVFEGSAGENSVGPGTTGNIAGVLTNQGMITVGGGSGGGSLHYPATGYGATLNDSGLLTNFGTIIVAADTTYYGPGASGSGGEIRDTGSFNNVGMLTLNGSQLEMYGYALPAATLDIVGALSNSGTLTVGAISAGGDVGSGALLLNTGAMINLGTIVLVGSSGHYTYGDSAGALIDAGALTNDGYVTVAAGVGSGTAASLTVTNGATLTDVGTIDGGGVVLNQGQILAEAGGNLSTASLVNDGTIQVVPSGTFFIGSVVTNSGGFGGTIDLAANAALTLTGSVGSGEDIAFTGHDATLLLGDAAAFAGVISGLDNTSKLDFLNLDVTTASAAGTTLTLGAAGGQTIPLSLGAPLAPGTSLVLKSDHAGGTDLLFHSPAHGS